MIDGIVGKDNRAGSFINRTSLVTAVYDDDREWSALTVLKRLPLVFGSQFIWNCIETNIDRMILDVYVLIRTAVSIEYILLTENNTIILKDNVLRVMRQQFMLKCVRLEVLQYFEVTKIIMSVPRKRIQTKRGIETQMPIFRVPVITKILSCIYDAPAPQGFHGARTSAALTKHCGIACRAPSINTTH